MEHNNAFKTCPLCQEQIRKEAVKCRYCGEWMDKSQVNTDSPSEGSDSIPALELPLAAAKVAQMPATNVDAQRSSDIAPPFPVEAAQAPAQVTQSHGEIPAKSADPPSRTGLMALNALYLLVFTFVSANEVKKLGTADLLAIFVIIAPFVLALLAAANLYNERKRKIAKWSNLASGICIILALFVSLPFVPFVAALFVFGFMALPLLLNVLAFWKQPK